MQSGHRLNADRSPEQRSAVTNRNALFLTDIDERGVFARRFRDLLSGFVADSGGWDVITVARAALCRRAAVLCAETEKLECALAKSDVPDAALAGLYTTMANSLRRILADLGLERRPRDISADLVAYLSQEREGASAANSSPAGGI